jgi:hypothetical protein
MKNIRNILLASFLALALTACAGKTTVRHSTDYQSLLESKKDTIVLPPEVLVNSVEFSGKLTRLYNYEHNIESMISDEICTNLDNKGLRAKFLPRRAIHEQDLEENAAVLSDRYKNIQKKLYKESSWENEAAFSINENVDNVGAKIGQQNHSSFIVMSYYSRRIKTTGSRAANILSTAFFGASASTPADVASLTIGILEADTGRVIWSNTGASIRGDFSSSSDKAKEKAELKSLIETILDPLLKPVKK